MTLRGSGGASVGFDPVHGINITGASSVSSATGNISMTGLGGNSATVRGDGIHVGAASRISTTGGDIGLSGTGNPSAGNSRGVQINMSSVISTADDTKTVTITGLATRGEGVMVDRSTISVSDAALAVIGNGSGNGAYLVEARLASSGKGTISVTGVSTNVFGTEVRDSTVTSQGAGIAITGQGGTNATGSGGVYVRGVTVIEQAAASVAAGSTGAISISGTAAGSGIGVLVDGGSLIRSAIDTTSSVAGSIVISGTGGNAVRRGGELVRPVDQ